MASNISDNKNNFEALYEAPWGGLNTDDDPTNIQLNQVSNCTNVRFKLGVITTSFFDLINTSLVDFTHPSGAGFYYVGMVSVGRYLIFFDNAGNILHYNPDTNSMVITSSGLISQFTSYRAINGSIYISDYVQGRIWQYTPTSYTTGTANSGAVYVAGKYTAVLKNYFLLANSNQPSDSPAVKSARFSWSSPNAYLTFDPTVDRTAGFNVLGDVTDDITGLFIQGNVGIIVRTQGLTQFSPTGDALGPFSFDSLWADDYGVGCDLPDTISTFGPMAVFGDSSGIYNFQGGITDISQGIKKILQTSLTNAGSDDANSQSYISGTLFGNAYGDNATDISYAFLVGAWANDAIHQNYYQGDIFIYSVHNKSWSKGEIDLRGILASQYPEVTSKAIGQMNFFKVIRAPKIQKNIQGVSSSNYVSTKFIPYILVSGQYGITGIDAVQYNLVLQLFEEDSRGSTSSSTIPMEIDFKTLEFKVGRKPTIRRIVVRASGKGTIIPFINNTQFTPIVLGTDFTPSPLQTFYSSGMFTGEEPQLRLVLDGFVGQIVKVLEAGTYADGDLI